jgi:hypothetical protein
MSPSLESTTTSLRPHETQAQATRRSAREARICSKRTRFNVVRGFMSVSWKDVMRGETVPKIRWNRRINSHRRFAMDARLEEQRSACRPTGEFKIWSAKIHIFRPRNSVSKFRDGESTAGGKVTFSPPLPVAAQTLRVLCAAISEPSALSLFPSLFRRFFPALFSFFISLFLYFLTSRPHSRQKE